MVWFHYVKEETFEWEMQTQHKWGDESINSPNESKSYEANEWHLKILSKFKRITRIAICYCRDILEIGQDVGDSQAIILKICKYKVISVNTIHTSVNI